MKCKKTGKKCKHDCISNNGGYAGDDCHIIHQKYMNQIGCVPALFISIMFVVSLIIIFI